MSTSGDHGTTNDSTRTWLARSAAAMAIVGAVLAGVTLGYVEARGSNDGISESASAGENRDSSGALSQDSDGAGDGRYVFATSYLVILEEAQDIVAAEGGLLLRGPLRAVDGATAELEVNSVLWSSTLGEDPKTIGVDVDAGPRDVAALRGLIDEEIVALVAGGRLLGVAKVAGSDLAGPTTDDLFFLGEAARLISSMGLPPGPSEGRCSRSVETVADTSTPIAALTSYFDVLGTDSIVDARATSAEHRDAAQRIALEAGTFEDPVTGENVHASENDLLWQLASGVGESAVEIHQEVPLLVTVPSRVVPGTIIAFFDSSSRRFIGWIDSAPPGWTGEDGSASTPSRATVKVFLEPPPAGAALAIAMRDVDQHGWDCPLAPGESPIVVVPFDAVAGEHRAWLMIDESRWVYAAKEDFASVDRENTQK